MGKRSVTVIGATAGLGLVLAVTAASVASASPAGVGGLTQRIEKVHTTLPIHAHTTVTATCAADEILTGGGYLVYSIGPNDKVFHNAPVDDKTWVIEILNETADGLQLDVYAVCLSRPISPVQ